MKVTAAALAAEREAARSADEIVRAEARIAWTKKKRDGTECPAERIPTPSDLAAWLPDAPANARAEAATRALAIVDTGDGRGFGDGHGFGHGSASGAGNGDGSGQDRLMAQLLADRLMDGWEQPPSVAHVEDLVLALHKLWREARKHDRTPRHPLAPLVADWQQRPLVGADERPTKNIPGALAWTRNVILHRDDGDQQHLPFDDAESVQPPPPADAARYEVSANLPYIELDSKLPWAMLDLLDFGPSRGRNGPVPVPQRVGWNLLLMPKPGEWFAEQATVTPTHTDLASGTWPTTSYRKGTHGPQLYQAARWLNDPDNATWFRRNERDRPILVVTFFAPPVAPYDPYDTVGVHIVLPDGGRRIGPQYDAHLRRILAATSYRQHRVYLAAVCLWDRHATVRGYLVQPTVPVVDRTAGGLVIGPDGKIATEKDGRPSKRATHRLAVQTGERELNPAFGDAFPWLEGRDPILVAHHRVADTTRERNEQRRLTLVTLAAMREQATRRGAKGRVIVTRPAVIDFEARYRADGVLSGADLADLSKWSEPPPPPAELEAVRLLPTPAHFAAYQARQDEARKRKARKRKR